MRRAVLALFAAFAVRVALAADQSVSAEAGNIFLTVPGDQRKQLTSSGCDSAPVLSPDGRWIVFVRAVPGRQVSTGIGEVDAGDLWQIDANGKNPTLLVRSRSSEKMENVIADFDSIQFSSDGRNVFFLTRAWATSGAVHVVDTTKAKERFVCPGSALEIVRSGEYRDCLLVQQHRYFIGGGSYDWFWLLRSDGKEIGAVGEDTENFKATFLSR